VIYTNKCREINSFESFLIAVLISSLQARIGESIRKLEVVPRAAWQPPQEFNDLFWLLSAFLMQKIRQVRGRSVRKRYRTAFRADTKSEEKVAFPRIRCKIRALFEKTASVVDPARLKSMSQGEARWKSRRRLIGARKMTGRLDEFSFWSFSRF
jgi:hypothetical protein